MYRHLIVPVDDSLLSSANVDAAVELAASLGARITFFHAVADLAATRDGFLLRAVAPDKYTERAEGETSAMLSKAIDCAVAAGVSCEAVSTVCDEPAEAIVDVALSRSCDLIVMASRGSRGLPGWLHSSQTERVLQRAPVALLVTRVASNDPLTASERAVAVLTDEHRSIAVAVRGLCDVLQQAESLDADPDRRTLDALLAYLQGFPQQQHHPKEEQHLHRWLRERAPECTALLRDLEAQHLREHARVDEMLACLKALRPGDTAAVSMLAAQARSFADSVNRHIGFEEASILPLARQALQEDDWREIAEAFESNEDPGFGVLSVAEFRRLFTRIAHLLPATTAHA